MRRWLSVLLLCAPASAWAAPEEPGPYTVGTWQAPADAPLPAVVYYPEDAPCPGAVVGLVHGADEPGASKARMGQLLASRGLVAVAPSFPGKLENPMPSDGDRLNQELGWVIQQAADPASPIHGKVDPSQLGVAGHSWGGIVFYAAASNPKI